MTVWGQLLDIMLNDAEQHAETTSMHGPHKRYLNFHRDLVNRKNIPNFCWRTTMPYLAHISLIVRDYDEAIAFYKKLGFELVEDTYIPSQDKRWVVIRPPAPTSSDTATSASNGQSATILLARAADDEQANFIGNQCGRRVFLFLATDDFERDHTHFTKMDVEWIREPKVEPYGKVAVWKDLYGNLWDLIQYS